MKTSALLSGFAMAALLAACASPADSGAPIEVALACTLPSNCVSSIDGGAAPLRFDGDAPHALSRLKRTLAGFPGARIVRSDASAVDTVFTTAVGFQDDVSFRIDALKQRIDFRSRSRIGLFDFGKNRSRMKEFAERFNSAGD
jgi:uncharacterized protein (DUF1499 family)